MNSENKTGYKQNGFVVLPLPMSDLSRQLGSVEKLTLGNKKLEVKIPPNVRIGQKVRLKGIAHYIDPQLWGEDLYLLIQAPNSVAYEFHRDMHLELALKESLFNNNYVKQDSWQELYISNKRLEVKIPSGFQIGTGKKIRLAGMAKYGNGGYEGDIYLSPTIISRPTVNWQAFFTNITKPSESKISIKFTIPLFVEIGGEFIYKKTSVEMTTGSLR